MTVTFELPDNIEETLRRELGDPNQVAKEATLIELYRQHKLTHHEVATALGLSRFETDDLLKRHGVCYDMTLEDIQRESASIGDLP